MNSIFSTWYSQILTKIRSDNILIGTNSALNFENFIKDLLNMLWNLELQNLNYQKVNYPGIDLADFSKKIAIQVKTTEESANKMIKSTLSKIPSNFKNYDIKIISLVNRSKKSIKNDITMNYKSMEFLNFDDLLKIIFNLDYIRKNEVKNIFLGHYNFLINEKKTTRLASIAISFLEKLKMDEIYPIYFNKFPFDIEKKIKHNQLNESTKKIIESCSIYSNEIDMTYNNFITNSKYNATLVIREIQRFYISILYNYGNENREINYSNILIEVIEKIYDKLFNNLSDTYDTDELRTAAEIIAINAFWNCHILEKPPSK